MCEKLFIMIMNHWLRSLSVWTCSLLISKAGNCHLSWLSWRIQRWLFCSSFLELRRNFSLKPEAREGNVDPVTILPSYIYDVLHWPFTQWPFYLGRSPENVAPSAQISAEAAMESGCVPKRVQRKSLKASRKPAAHECWFPRSFITNSAF